MTLRGLLGLFFLKASLLSLFIDFKRSSAIAFLSMKKFMYGPAHSAFSKLLPVSILSTSSCAIWTGGFFISFANMKHGTARSPCSFLFGISIEPIGSSSPSFLNIWTSFFLCFWMMLIAWKKSYDYIKLLQASVFLNQIALLVELTDSFLNRIYW